MKDNSGIEFESALSLGRGILDHHPALYISTELKHLRGSEIGIEN